MKGKFFFNLKLSAFPMWMQSPDEARARGVQHTCEGERRGPLSGSVIRVVMLFAVFVFCLRFRFAPPSLSTSRAPSLLPHLTSFPRRLSGFLPFCRVSQHRPWSRPVVGLRVCCGVCLGSDSGAHLATVSLFKILRKNPISGIIRSDENPCLTCFRSLFTFHSFTPCLWSSSAHFLTTPVCYDPSMISR